MSIKAKTYAVDFAGQTYLVQAITKAGACRDLLAHLAGGANADLATGEQLYAAGKTGQEIIGLDRYANVVDPNQMPLAGIPETARDEIPA
jgi:hypothetical protein